MKKLMIMLLAVFTVSLSNAQTRKAKTILDKVSAKYDSYKTLQSNFNLNIVSNSGESSNVTGKIYMDKPTQRLKIELGDQDIFADAKTTWTVSKEVKEIQINPTDLKAQKIGPSNIFTFYKKGFNYNYVGSKDAENIGKVDVIELSPIDNSTNYSKITLRINGNSHISDVTILDKSGAKYTYEFNALYVNNSISDEDITFQRKNYTKYEVIDLR